MHEPECQLVDHVAPVQLDSVDTEPMDACNALTASHEGVRRGHVNGAAIIAYLVPEESGDGSTSIVAEVIPSRTHRLAVG